MWFVVSLHPKQTALYVASQEGHHELVKRLLGTRAGVNILHMPSVSVIMLLLIVHMQEICKLMCTFLFKGQGPLWIASFHGHLNVVKTLLAGGANINQTDEVGYLHTQVLEHMCTTK